MSSLPVVTFVETRMSRYSALYVDDALVLRGRDMSPSDVLLEVAKHQPCTVRVVTADDETFADEGTPYEDGRPQWLTMEFPKRLQDVIIAHDGPPSYYDD